MAWNDGLEGQGLEIAASDARRIRVVAGPGSGKTFCLMRRIARLLEAGADARRILLVTFTRTAAHDLRNALSDLGITRSDEIVAGTLHSFCFRLLNQEAVFAQTNRVPRPLFNYEREILVQDLMRLLNRGKREIERTLKAFEAAWARLQSDDPGWPQDREDRNFQQSLLNYLRFHEAMLIEEVIPETLSYLRVNGAADELTAFDSVFVDEYQDLNRAEQELMNILAANANKMIIGDEDQSIYEGFRNAHPEGIRTFHEIHIDTVDYPLEECRRCPTGAVLAADQLIQNNVNRQPRNLRARDENVAGSIHCVQWMDLDAQREGITSFLEKRIQEGVNPGKILILAPRRDMGNAVRDSLRELGIEAQSFFTEDIFSNEEAQRSMTLLNLLVSDRDKVALRTALGIGVNGANSAGYSRIRAHCEETGNHPWDVFRDLQQRNLQIPYTDRVVTRFEELVEELDELRSLPTEEAIERLFPPAEEWTFPFIELWEDENLDDRTFEDLRNLIRDEAVNPEMPVDVDYVRIMSLHKSKGLTAEITIILGAIQGFIPRLDQDGTPDQILRGNEEQRRLFFVGITRHTSELVISSLRTIPKTLGYKLGIKVPRGRELTMRALGSVFITEMGNTIPRAIRGEDWNP